MPSSRAPTSRSFSTSSCSSTFAFDNCSSRLVASSKPSSLHHLDVNTCQQQYTSCQTHLQPTLFPGHVGIPGNERADRVAKAALSLAISSVKVSAMDFLPRARLLMRKEWQEIWNCCDGNKLHAINPTVGVTKQNDSFSRRDAVILNRLQIGQTRATHAHLLGDDEAFLCYMLYFTNCEPDSHRMSTV